MADQHGRHGRQEINKRSKTILIDPSLESAVHRKLTERGEKKTFSGLVEDLLAEWCQKDEKKEDAAE